MKPAGPVPLWWPAPGTHPAAHHQDLTKMQTPTCLARLLKEVQNPGPVSPPLLRQGCVTSLALPSPGQQ